MKLTRQGIGTEKTIIVQQKHTQYIQRMEKLLYFTFVKIFNHCAFIYSNFRPMNSPLGGKKF